MTQQRAPTHDRALEPSGSSARRTSTTARASEGSIEERRDDPAGGNFAEGEETLPRGEHAGAFADGEETLPEDDRIGTFADRADADAD